MKVLMRTTSAIALIFIRKSPIVALSDRFQICRHLFTARCIGPSMAKANTADSSTTTIRVLALHGSEGNEIQFAETLSTFRESLLQNSSTDWQLTALTAPISKGKGFSWWSMPPFMRSFNATVYHGFSISEALVVNAMEQVQPNLVVAHSQGAILTLALIALGKITQHPSLGYILNGVAWPNPYTMDLEGLQVSLSPSSVSSLRPRVLLLVGDRDGVNPPEQGRRVGLALETAGFAVTTLTHNGTHAFPTSNPSVLNSMTEWLSLTPKMNG
jgi:predicted esterase